jgi:peptide chain release factor subunit 1
MTAFDDVSEQTLRSLARTAAPEEVVLSMYLDLDPARFATAPARASEIDSLLDSAHRAIEAGERPHAELMALRSAHERAREILTGEQTWAEGARAVALFLSPPLELERVLRVPHPLPSDVVIAREPFIAPIAAFEPVGRVCVALVDERFARILRGSPSALHEVISFGDPVHGRHDQGGWSQARYQRSIQEDVDDHLRHVARVLRDLLRLAPYQRLLIACTEPLWPRALNALPAEVRGLVREPRLVLDLGDASIEDVHAAARPVLEEEQRVREDELFEELREHLGRHGDARAAAGLDAVLFALVERRVAALVYEEGLQAGGVTCPRCGWMGSHADSCPVDAGPLEERQNMLEDAVRSAVGQSAEVLAVRERPELGPLGGIAATLRF